VWYDRSCVIASEDVGRSSGIEYVAGVEVRDTNAYVMRKDDVSQRLVQSVSRKLGVYQNSSLLLRRRGIRENADKARRTASMIRVHIGISIRRGHEEHVCMGDELNCFGWEKCRCAHEMWVWCAGSYMFLVEIFWTVSFSYQLVFVPSISS
jgi:hypothetical protein